ncbi:hypothetical protein MPSEU_000683100 [Mayamaea pseudoterrestris]|nr:hypothetical protein MPSEU_000683100 [Mayamaea pseudoterrestris]
MRYTSTRSRSLSVSFEQAICSGYAPDGGLFVPESLPEIALSDLQEWKNLSYPDITTKFLRRFIDQEEVCDADLHNICIKAFQGFENPPNAVPVVKVGHMYVAELFRGPTFCFKDLGMQVMIHILSYFCSKRNQKMSLIVSTTGDTGPAAVQAVKDVANPLLTILVHYPHEQISEFQRKQLTTANSQYVSVAAFEGGGDDMDAVIKRMLANPPQGSVWTGVNSYNICRPLMQTIHYVWTYLRILDDQKIPFSSDHSLPLIDFILPTGAMGNIAAGFICQQMRLPINKLVAAVNVNDIVHRAMSVGDFSKSDAMIKTLSEAINIQIPYNFERLLFYLTDQNHKLVKEWMSHVESEGGLTLPAEWLEKLQESFVSARVTDDEMCETIRRVRTESSYWIDPHTAVAFCAARQLRYDESKTSNRLTAILATASPCKFREALQVAVGTAGWDDYFESDFPSAALQVYQLEEQPLTIYKAKDGASLEENHVEWERIARDTLKDLAELSSD